MAEHLQPERGEGFVADLARLAPADLFSAAVPGQGDPKRSGHVNERWQSYWASLFAARGYEAVDCVRPAVWENPEVEMWYAQNTLLYIRSERLANDESLRRAKQENAAFPLSVVHPNPNEDRVSPAVGRRKVRKLKRKVERLEQELEAERSKGTLRRILRR